MHSPGLTSLCTSACVYTRTPHTMHTPHTPMHATHAVYPIQHTHCTMYTNNNYIRHTQSYTYPIPHMHTSHHTPYMHADNNPNTATHTSYRTCQPQTIHNTHVIRHTHTTHTSHILYNTQCTSSTYRYAPHTHTTHTRHIPHNTRTHTHAPQIPIHPYFFSILIMLELCSLKVSSYTLTQRY